MRSCSIPEKIHRKIKRSKGQKKPFHREIKRSGEPTIIVSDF
jgi:hypothetical protein